MKKHLTYSNVVASVALFFAITGGAFAASGALKKNSVTNRAIKDNAVTSPKVKNGSLLAKDFKAGQLPSGPTGAAGSAKAFGFVGADGSVDATRSSSNLSARRASPGVYCLKVAGVDTKVLVATLDSGTSNNSEGDDEWGLIDVSYPGGLSGSCDADESTVRTWYAVNTSGIQITHSNMAFHVVIE